MPVVSVVTGEGGSGGALALGVANRVLMLENAVYSVLSPEGFAAILWKDASRSDEACGVMKLTAADLLELEVVDRIIPEPEGGAHDQPRRRCSGLWTRALVKELATPCGKHSGPALAAGRYQKFRAMGREGPEKGAYMNGIKLIGTGSAVPSKVVTNDDLGQDRGYQRRVDLHPHRHPHPTLLHRRREPHLPLSWPPPGQATGAGRRSAPADIGVCLVATVTADYSVPLRRLPAPKGAGLCRRIPSALI